MSMFEIKMPKMGESVEEATITKWFVKEGDQIEEDTVLLEIATDKVDSEIPSPVAGRIHKIFFQENELVAVGKVIAVVNTANGEASETEEKSEVKGEPSKEKKQSETSSSSGEKTSISSPGRFYSPLVRTIALKENLSGQELESIIGSGLNGRVRKKDVLDFVVARNQRKPGIKSEDSQENRVVGVIPSEKTKLNVQIGPQDEVIEMDRIRRLIADHMVMSKHTAPHVTNFIEADVTNLVLWRNKIKEEFEKREKQKFTFMPAFTDAVAKALRDFPRVNVAVDGYKIILRKNINIGIAVALPDGNLIVPVIKNADQKSILGLALEINKMAETARKGKLSPDDIQAGTFSISNFGTFKNLMGTPIINQPQAAILAVGTIEKKPAVLETPSGDVIAIRHKMFLSLTYDHRVIDGALGGAFLKRIAEYLEAYDLQKTL